MLLALFATACNRSQPYLLSSPTGLLTLPSPPTGTGGVTASPPATIPGPPNAFAPSSTPNPQADWDRKITMMDESNRQLHAQLAQSQQQMQLYKERSDLMQQQLRDLTGQLEQARIASARPLAPTTIATAPPAPSPAVTTPKTVERSPAFNQESHRKSGARLTANTSPRIDSEAIRALGYDVEVQNGVVRLRVPSDQLFQPNTSQLTSSASGILDRIAEVIRNEYPKQRVAIEGHTDNAPLYGGTYATSHQLASAQTTTLFEALTRRNTIPAAQLFTLAHGSNFSLQDNQSPAGRAANRRMEFVIYSETY